MLISRAAIMYHNGEIIEGLDYGAIARIAQKLGWSGERIEGFVTSTGEFVLPDEAAEIAKQANQVINVRGKLSPEDLWPPAVVE